MTDELVVGELYVLSPECASLPCYRIPGKPDGPEWRSAIAKSYTLRPGDVCILVDVITLGADSIWVKLMSGSNGGWIAHCYFDSLVRLADHA